MRYNYVNSPGGMKTYLPKEAVELDFIQTKIKDIFQLWNYQPIITPTLEYYDALSVGMGPRLQKELYKFIDYEGDIIALRPEMTAPIARIVAGRLHKLELPLRFSYNASVYRYDEPQVGKNREIYQMGIEFIGRKNPLADAEVIMLAIESLINAGIKDVKIDLGHAGFINGILKQLNLNGQEGDQIKEFLIKRDIVGLKEYAGKLDNGEKDLILSLNSFRGDIKFLAQVKDMVRNKASLKALQNLQEVYGYLCDYGMEAYINFDLSLIRGLDYYTGVVFSGYSEKIGYNICGGGRYDNLIGQYGGTDVPAIGFAIGLERVRLVLQKENFQFPVSDNKYALVYNESARQIIFQTASRIRKAGYSAILIESYKDKLDMLEQNGFAKVLSFRNIAEKMSVNVIDIKNEQEEELTVEVGWEETLWQK